MSKLDAFWEFGTAIDPENRQTLTCNLCGKRMAGGISRLKYHIAQISGHDVIPCTAANEDHINKAKKAIEETKQKKQFKEAVRHQIASRSGSGCGAGASGTSPETFSTQQSTMPSPSTASPMGAYVSRCSAGGQPSVKSMLKVKEKKDADTLVGRCLLWSDIPFNFANNPFYMSMFEAAAVIGPGYKPPTYEELRGPILQNEKAECSHRLEDLRKSWELTGCTVMSDGWTDMKGRTLLNFLVHCPRGTMFLKSVDASAHVKDAGLLCRLLDDFIQEVGPQHVVQVITDNAANYVSAGRMLMDMYPSLFWTPCAAHCLDLMLEDLAKIDWIKDTIDSARGITKFIYNHAAVLSLMRTFTGDRELVRPAITCFATSFISLQSLLVSMWDLQQMFLSPEWRALSFSTRPEGQAICRLVNFHQTFWDDVREVCAVTEPLVRVLRLVDGDKPAMGYLYEAMDRAKESIRAYYEDKGDRGQERQQIIWGMIDARWNNTLHRPIHAAGLYLNPAFGYSCGFRFDGEVMAGFYECVHRMVPSADDRAELSQELEVYKRATGLLGFHLTIHDRTNLMPSKLHLVSNFRFLFLILFLN